MPTGTQAPPICHEFFVNGIPAAGYKLFSYEAGTTTKVATYSDVALAVPNANPIVLDAEGRCPIFLAADSYKFVLAPPDDTDPPTSPEWTRDNIGAVPTSDVDTDVTGTAGEAITAGDAVYLSAGDGGRTAGRWYKTNATDAYASSGARAVGMAPSSISSGVAGSIRMGGRITGLSSLTTGQAYYLDTVAGGIALSAAANARQIGVADSTTSLVLSQGIPVATGAIPGVISSEAQTIGGAKLFTSVPTFTAGTGSGVARASGVLNYQFASPPSASVGSTPTELFSYTVPADTLAVNGQALRLSVLVAIAANANNKKIDLKFGGKTLTLLNAAVNVANAQALFIAWIIRTAETAQVLHGLGTVATNSGVGGAAYGASDVGTEDLTTALDLVIEATGVNNDDLRGYTFFVEVLG
jgi:hypothetical protein